MQDAEIFKSDVTDTEFFEEQPSATDLLLDAIKGIVFSYVGVLAVAMLLLWLTPLWETVDKKYENASFGKYAAAFGIGFAVLVALPLASVILMVTGFGLRLGFTLLMLYLAAMAVSPVFLSYILGKLLWRKAFKKAVNYPAELAIGVLAWRILASVPLCHSLSVYQHPIRNRSIRSAFRQEKNDCSANSGLCRSFVCCHVRNI